MDGQEEGASTSSFQSLATSVRMASTGEVAARGPARGGGRRRHQEKLAGGGGGGGQDSRDNESWEKGISTSLLP
jgi:hypothetical protein